MIQHSASRNWITEIPSGGLEAGLWQLASWLVLGEPLINFGLRAPVVSWLPDF
jgi:hypothetical protein